MRLTLHSHTNQLQHVPDKTLGLVKDGQFVEKNKKMNEVANMQAVFPGAQVCVEYNQHVVPFADSPPP